MSEMSEDRSSSPVVERFIGEGIMSVAHPQTWFLARRSRFVSYVTGCTRPRGLKDFDVGPQLHRRGAHRITKNDLHDGRTGAQLRPNVQRRSPSDLWFGFVSIDRLPLRIGSKVLDINPPFLSHELPRQRSRCNWLTCDTPHHSSKEGTRTLCCRTVIYMHIDIHVHRTITRNQREDVFPLLFLAPTLSLSLFFPSGPDRKSAYRSSSDLSVSSLGGKLSHLGCTTSANKDQDAGSKEQ